MIWQFTALVFAIGINLAACVWCSVAYRRYLTARRRYDALIADALAYDMLLRELVLQAFVMRHMPIWQAWRPLGDVRIEVVSTRHMPGEVH